MKKRDVRAAYTSLRKSGADADKAALLALLAKTQPPASLRERLAIYLERVWPSVFGERSSWRIPALGFATAVALVLVVSVSLTGGAPTNEVPEIVDLEFEGGSAMVFEHQTEQTTLIWLSEVEEESLEEAEEPETLIEEIIEPAAEDPNTEIEKI